MKKLNKVISLVTLAAILASVQPSFLHGEEEYCSTVAGCGYEECRSAPCLTPAIALAAVALVAIVAVALQNSDKGSCHHSHAHCS